MARLGHRVHRVDPHQRSGAPHEGGRRVLLHRAARRVDGVLRRHFHRRRHRPAVGARQPHARAHEQLVPLREALRGHHRVHRLHGHQVLVGRYRQGALVQVLPVRHRGHQHPHRRGQRLRERHPRLGHHLGVLRGRHAVRRLAQRVQRRGGHHQHRLHDRLVRHLHFQEAPGHAVAGHDLGVHHRLRPVELLLHLQLPAHALLVLRPGPAAGPHRGGVLLEQRRLDPEPRVHTGHLVHVRPVRAGVPGLQRVQRAVGEQPEREPGRVRHRASGQHRRVRLHHVPRQEAQGEPGT